MAQFVECVVVGAGVVGLATARALAVSGREVLVVEAADRIGSVTSARNSEVIHAGIYYPKGSLKARCCVEGKVKLYDYCERRGIGHRRCGKLIVATSEEQVATLEAIKGKAAANGVEDLEMKTASEAKELEPEGELEDAGGMVALNAPFQRAEVSQGGGGRSKFLVEVGGESPMALTCSTLINSAGLAAPRIARHIQGMPLEAVPGDFYAKGNYYSLIGKSPFNRLVYPVPEEAGLGVHATVDLQGRARFGPDVEWVPDESDYDVDPRRADSFYSEVRKYWPALPDGALVPDYSGIRPKIGPPGTASADFQVQTSLQHGVAGLVNLFGIESPGLTASLALADKVVEALVPIE